MKILTLHQEGIFLSKISKITKLNWWRAVVPPPHLGSKYVEYSTKNQTSGFVVKAIPNTAYKTEKSKNIPSTNFYIPPSKFYRLKFVFLMVLKISGLTN
ncbi:hypothetical protein A7907_06415 [Acinetobacter baumannii]|uniref:hypothetical protein n=1 Tax=Acinetobacter baumannii TaxID=470 RepID=UPI00053BE6E1|nr:hypothetical protein [Acinetobacter baumannii]ELY0711393.1 hypothetical protein [Acinetobacter baumannii]MCT9297082.1 hypothetical protein [Acinetobacter baumannii]MCT9402909.1 hypothetical protein [Acinetobacter baumannii]OBC92932.1 hypothetical protein A7907_06415 [Acinetobacter baumannii]